MSYYRLFEETAKERYLDVKEQKVIHQSLAQYFLGKWSDGKRKPLKLKIWKNKTVNADRQVASQVRNCIMNLLLWFAKNPSNLLSSASFIYSIQRINLQIGFMF